MQFRKTPIAVAALALTGAMPIVAEAAPTATWTQPQDGAVLRGRISGSQCAASANSETRRVSFYATNWQINNDYRSPFNCDFDTTRLKDGNYTLRARAFNASGSYRDTSINVTIANNTAAPAPAPTPAPEPTPEPTPTPSPSTGTAPTVAFTAPAEGGILAGNVQGPPNCIVEGSNISKVMFYLNDQWTNTDGNLSNGLGCWIDTTKYPDGAYTVKAVAYNAAGATTTTTRQIKIQNTQPAPEPTPQPGSGPTVSFTAPAEGGTLSGNVQGPPNCIVQGSNISKVMFYLNDKWTNTDGNLSNGLGCWIDTTKYPNGTYTVKAIAYDAAGATATTTRQVKIQNGTTTTPDDEVPPPTGGTINSADILGSASSEIPFAQQSGYGGQVLGQYPSPSQIPETTGIEGSLLPNGERIRLGKQADPANSSKKALVFQLAPTDPDTSGNPRAEISFSKTIEYNKVYWVAMRAYVHDWGSLASNDVSVFGTQLHSGDNSRGLSPSFSLIANNGGRTFQVYAVTSTSSSPSQSNSVTTRYSVGSIPFGRWVDFVFKFRHNVSGNGLLQVWMDGQQIVNHTGNLGFNTPGYNDYAKFGYYNWSAGFNSPRKVMLKAPTIVRDPTGSTYTAADLRAHINK